MTIKIRTAVAGDEVAIAHVHIHCWQESYKGLLPQDYLDSLSGGVEARTQMWIRIIASPERWAWVAESSEGIVGFVLFGTPRDANREAYIELGAIYLRDFAKGKGIGYSLLSKGFESMIKLGYQKSYCWVLDGNPTIEFYKKSGACFSGQTKEDEIGGQKFKELAYEWESLA